jgi:preprotein translocase subunit SecG
MVYYILNGLYVVVCILLLIVVLLQQGKGDVAATFGGGSSTANAFGARGGATVLTRATTVLAVLFIVGSLALAIMGQKGPGSLMGGTPASKPVSAPAPAAPATQTPAPAAQTPAPTAQTPAPAAQTPPAPAK